MKNIKNEIAQIISKQIQSLSADGTEILSVADIEQLLEIPQDNAHGDYAFPCFRLAKALHKAPLMIAADIAKAIEGETLFEKVEQVNAYINMFIDKHAFMKVVLGGVCESKEMYGSSNIGQGRNVVFDYSSPNIAKPFHIGHIRSTVIGDSLYKIYKFIGYNSIGINHLGDYGTQFGKMIVAYRKWGNEDDVKNQPIKSLLSYYVKFHEEAEKDPALEDEARITFAKLEAGEPEEYKLWQWFREESLNEFKRVYAMLDIDFDSWNGEAFYSDKMPAVIKELEDKNLLVESQGAMVVDLSEFGLEPALIKKSDGTSLYITRDLATAIYRKNTYDFAKAIYVVASQQNLHFQQLFHVIEKMGYDWYKDCIHVPFGLVSLEEGTMSTRKGRVVFLEDVLKKAVEKTYDIVKEKGVNEEIIDETAKVVGIGAVKFQELSAGRIKDYTFNWDKILNFDGETGPYVQYTHARAASILRDSGIDVSKLSVDDIDLKYLSSESAYELIKMIYRFPETVVDAADKLEPSVVTRYIVDIAQLFNKFYHDEHIIKGVSEDEKKAKVLLTVAAKTTLANGLALLGIKAPDRM